ncbi:MAG: hypothetical protein WD733_22990 [Bryobacterales bacterium]
MSSLNPSGTPSEPESSAAPDLQFEQAEYDEVTPSLACETCKQSISGEYYLINGSYFCSPCRWAREGPVEPERSSFGRFLRAVVYGTGAAAVGTLIYFAISWATGYEFGLIAIVVGWMVGKAVMSGSGNRGGRVYQALAVFLTYCAIVSSYVPLVIKGLTEASEQETAQGATEAPDSGAATGVAGGEPPSDTVSMANATPPVNPPVPQSSDAEPQQTTGPAPETVDLTSANVGQLLAVSAVVLAISFLAPFLAGWENIFGLVIIGIGLFEAWKHSARRVDTIEGPFSAGSPAPAATQTGAA